MNWLIYIHIGLSFAAVPLLLALTVAAWRRRQAAGVFSFLLLMADCALWALSGCLSMLAPSQRLALYGQLPLRMGAVALAPLLVLAFTLEYTGRRAWLQPRRFVWIALIPLITLALVATPLRSSVIADIAFTRFGGLFVMQDLRFGPWFPIHRAYSYGLGITSLLLMLVQVARAEHFYRTQAMILFLGMVLAFGMNAIGNFLVPSGIPRLDLTLAGFAVGGVIWSWALFRVRLLDLMPVALDAVFASMNDGVIILDRKRCIVDLNEAAAALIERPRSASIGAVLSEVSPELAAALQSADRHFERAEISIGGHVLELRVSALQGRRRTVVGQLAVLRDITERAQMMRDLDAYARTVAHDLKDPLAVITGYVEILRGDEARFDEQTRRHLSAIGKTGYKMVDIVNALLLLASVRSAAEVKTTSLDMADVVANALQRVANLSREAEAAITLPESWPVVLSYAPWVEEIWVNYLSNALKYGGRPPRIELGSEAWRAGLRFWVRDHGPGLTSDSCSRVFNEFERLGSESSEGHGLGLAIVARIATKLGGSAGVDSQPGEGSTFWFTLPTA